MKTSIFTMSIALVSALTLVGCGSDSSSGSSNDFSATNVSCTVKQNSSATVTCTSSQITIVTKEKSTYSNDLTLLEMGKTNECKEFTDTMNSAD